MVNLWLIIGITIYLVGGLEPWFFFKNDFSIILGMSSSQLICLLIFLPKMFGSKDSYVYIYILYNLVGGLDPGIF